MPLDCWHFGFEPRWGNECSSVVCLCDESITLAEESYRLCCVVVCDLETSRMGAPYIYQISRLRVNKEIFISRMHGANIKIKICKFRIYLNLFINECNCVWYILLSLVIHSEILVASSALSAAILYIACLLYWHMSTGTVLLHPLPRATCWPLCRRKSLLL